jgi:hypothetical protein
VSSNYFSAPGDYRIEIQGDVPSNWSDRFGGMKLFASSLNDETNKVTFLQGKVRDQSELSGILNSIYELHLSLLSVQYLGSDSSSADVTANESD